MGELDRAVLQRLTMSFLFLELRILIVIYRWLLPSSIFDQTCLGLGTLRILLHITSSVKILIVVLHYSVSLNTLPCEATGHVVRGA